MGRLGVFVEDFVCITEEREKKRIEIPGSTQWHVR